VKGKERQIREVQKETKKPEHMTQSLMEEEEEDDD
jgi:hypothetical protein